VDGWRCLARVDDGRLLLTSRWLYDLTIFAELREPPQGLADDCGRAPPIGGDCQWAVDAGDAAFGEKHWVSTDPPIRAPAMRRKITSAAKSKPVRRLPTVIVRDENPVEGCLADFPLPHPGLLPRDRPSVQRRADRTRI
jgi:hypothetical protein